MDGQDTVTVTKKPPGAARVVGIKLSQALDVCAAGWFGAFSCIFHLGSSTSAAIVFTVFLADLFQN